MTGFEVLFRRENCMFLMSIVLLVLTLLLTIWNVIGSLSQYSIPLDI